MDRKVLILIHIVGLIALSPMAAADAFNLDTVFLLDHIDSPVKVCDSTGLERKKVPTLDVLTVPNPSAGVRTIQRTACPGVTSCDEFGGVLSMNHDIRKTGFFHTQQINGQWWLIDPHGDVFLSIGMSSVAPTGGNAQGFRDAYPATLADVKDRPPWENPERYLKWAHQTIGLLQSMGFNTLGAWSDDSFQDGFKTGKAYPWTYGIFTGAANAGVLSRAGNGAAAPLDSTPMARTPILALNTFKNDPEYVAELNKTSDAVLDGIVATLLTLKSKCEANPQHGDCVDELRRRRILLHPRQSSTSRESDQIIDLVVEALATSTDLHDIQEHVRVGLPLVNKLNPNNNDFWLTLIFKPDPDPNSGFKTAFENYAFHRAQGLIAPTRKDGTKIRDLSSDPMIIGYLIDSEPPFRPDTLDVFLRLPITHYARKMVGTWIDDYLGAENSFKVRQHILNGDPDVTDHAADGFALTTLTMRTRQAFLQYVAKTYFSVAHRAVRNVDTNHLLLGWEANFPSVESLGASPIMNIVEPALLCAARDGDPLSSQKGSGQPYMDAISLDYFNFAPEQNRLAFWSQIPKDCAYPLTLTPTESAPIIVTAFSARVLTPANSGAGKGVTNAMDRGKFYQNYALSLLRSPAVVGWHWFGYMGDYDDLTKKTDAGGLVDEDFKLYGDADGTNAQNFTRAVTTLNNAAYGLRGNVQKFCSQKECADGPYPGLENNGYTIPPCAAN